MSYLIEINEKTKQVLHPEILKLCDSFTLLNEKEMLYVVLFTDYNSIYKQFPEHERRRRAMWHAFDENEDDLIKSQRILNAIEDYTALQYNPKQELARTFRKRIDQLSEIIQLDDSPTNLKKNLELIKMLEDQITTLNNQITEQFKEDGVIKGDRQLSFLEKAISNKKLYKSIKQNKPKANVEHNK